MLRSKQRPSRTRQMILGSLVPILAFLLIAVITSCILWSPPHPRECETKVICSNPEPNFASDTRIVINGENPAATVTTPFKDGVIRWPAGTAAPGNKGKEFIDGLSKSGASNAILFQLIDNVSYVYPASVVKDGFNDNLVHTLTASMQRLCSQGVRLKNFEAPFTGVADPGLMGSTVLKYSGFFTYCNRLQVPGLRAMPRPYFDLKDLGKGDSTAWSTKMPKAIFRGSLSSEARLNLYKVWKSSSALQEVLDVGITKIPDGAPAYSNTSLWSVRWCPGCPAKWAKEEGIDIAPRMEMQQQQQYKYVVSVDGAGCADRLGHLLAGKFVILRQDTPLIEHYYGLLSPYVHYVPVKEDFSDIEEKIRWLQSHDDLAQQIIQEANNFAATHLSRDGMSHSWNYFVSLASALSSPSAPAPGAAEYRRLDCP